MFIYAKMPQSISAEAYKSIRTSLKYASVDKTIKTIVVTSSIPGEGKSTIAGNLGLCLSESGNNVLVIDCDLRRPSLHRKFKISNMTGLTDILLDKDRMGDSIHEYSSRLSIITAGTIPPNPSEILGSRTFEKFLREIR
ncbi:MAG: CpsD/CapB family tyrosine-protein kinase, partial [Peptostreptococcaceae bacterium]